MPKITDTYANAYACCDQVLMETGKFPTIDAIKTRIGVNSPNTINNAIKAWTQAFAERQLDKQSRPNIPACLLESVEKTWKLATIEAKKIYEDKENTFKITLAELQNTVARQQEALTHYGVQVEKLNTQHEQLLAKIQSANELNAQLTQGNKQRQEQIAALESQLTSKDAHLLEQEAKWQERQEQDQQWFARRLDEEKTFMEQNWREKNHRQHEAIQSLTLSEESLRQTCVSLSRDHKKVTEELKALQKTVDKKRRGVVKNKRFPKAL
ncbi:hypothetical protein CRENPOLYSF2_4550001 [Crenothrix polyspora]|uniref:KfrA N-terminal DNA-binding domain-containing protein n=1 Tax=Crenothrix polyspora TaxID=360316 RepID=A0A1R4HFP8_9GAMM|nr:DNA-binding protein [Crenothrix polyspora]SJM95055.1 hypothetical protein CRENPOLYSF2_4550001 [Crenothrix polyspora]